MPAKHNPLRFTPELRAEYLSLWSTMKVRPEKIPALRATATRLLRGYDRYKALEKRLNIPAAFLMVVHDRESSGRWGTYLGNGQSLNQVTTIVPKGRGPFETFEDGAYDALIQVQGMGGVPLDQWDEAGLAWYTEKMNGPGYRMKGLRSPYLWGGTNHQEPGKYVRDGVFDPTVMDPQLGTMAIYSALLEQRPELRLGGETPAQPVQPPRPTPAPKPSPVPRPPPAGPQAPSELTFIQRLWAAIRAAFS